LTVWEAEPLDEDFVAGLDAVLGLLEDVELPELLELVRLGLEERDVELVVPPVLRRATVGGASACDRVGGVAVGVEEETT
jgi:hypothetical protein